MAQKITPFLWFNNNAEEAANFYASVFKNSKVGAITRYNKESAAASGQPEGSVMTVGFELEGQEFAGLNGGPIFSFTPAVSFFVNCSTPEEVDDLYQKLSEGGSVLMPLQEYPFSKRYAWVSDRFGVSWQLNAGESTQKISVALLFVGNNYGKAEEAINLYTSLFENSEIKQLARRAADDATGGEKEGTLMYGRFTLAGQEFAAMESNGPHNFTFTEASSLVINCKDQAEVDHFWNELTKEGEPGPCGWLKDRYGLSWQVVPTRLNEMIADPDPEKSRRAMEAMLKMHKLDIATLEAAYNGTA